MPRARWSALATADNVPHLRQAVVDFACANGIGQPLADDIRLAVSEAVSNVVVHAYHRFDQPGSVHVAVTVERDGIELLVADGGGGFARRDDSPGVGLGLPLINRLADQVELRRPRDGDGTELWMRFGLGERSDCR
jgi:serine/threonine-protein kinase RsbW